jgi:hypothetical protein
MKRNDWYPIARSALQAYQLKAKAVALVASDWNHTFKVDADDGATYALRIYLPTRRTDWEVGTPRRRPHTLVDRGPRRGDRPTAPARPILPLDRGPAPLGHTVPPRRALAPWANERGPRRGVLEGNVRARGPGRTTGARAAARRRTPTRHPLRSASGQRAHQQRRDRIDRLRRLHARLAGAGPRGDDVGGRRGRDRVPYREAVRERYERVAPWPERRRGEIDTFAANRRLLKADDVVRERTDRDDDQVRDALRRHARAIGWFAKRPGS